MLFVGNACREQCFLEGACFCVVIRCRCSCLEQRKSWEHLHNLCEENHNLRKRKAQHDAKGAPAFFLSVTIVNAAMGLARLCIFVICASPVLGRECG